MNVPELKKVVFNMIEGLIYDSIKGGIEWGVEKIAKTILGL